MFQRVIMQDQPEIAKINRKTGTLYLSKNIWPQLPREQKHFVLLHEQGHLRLQTADEFQANKFAVSRFAPERTLSDKKLGKRIIIMRDIMAKANSGFSVGAAIGGALGSIVETLPVLGIGSKSRQKEAQATAQANVAVLAAQADLLERQAKIEKSKGKETTKVFLILGVFAILGVVIYLILKK